MTRIILSLILLVSGISVESTVVGESKQELAKMPWDGSYRPSSQISTPKTLLFWTIKPEVLEENASVYARNGFSGILVGGIQSDWSSDIWARDNKAHTIGMQDELLQTWRRVNKVCRREGLDSNFIKVAYYEQLPDWFNDVGWDVYTERLRQAAHFARLAGFKGVAIDTEYVGEQYDFNWEGYSYEGYTRRDLTEKVRERMRASAAAMFDAYPEMEWITFPGGDHEIIVDILAGWIEEAAARNAPGGVHLFTEWSYLRTNPKAIVLYAQTLHRQIERLVSPRAWRYWREHCTVGPAGWPTGKEVPSQRPELQGAQLTPDEFRSQYAGLLLAGKRYIWIYPHAVDYLPKHNTELGKQPDTNRCKIAYVPNLDKYLQVLRERLIPDDDTLIDVALRVRDADTSDFSDKLGMVSHLHVLGPGLRFDALQSTTDDSRTASLMDLSNKLEEIQEERWKGAPDPDLQAIFGTRTTWNLIGPFDNTEGKGFDAVYPPEREIDLSKSYTGVDGPVSWEVWTYDDPSGSVDLKAHYEKNQWVCAYALGFLTVEQETSVQIRVGVNDAMKMWLGGELAFVKPPDSRAMLDNWIIETTLKKGTTPVLLKVCNEEVDWGFYFRVTDKSGAPSRDVHFSTHPPKN